MSNYNTRLSNNNTDLQTILDTIKTLPDEGMQVEESKIITKTATGKELVSLNDVSEVPHNISVSVRGKNLVPDSYFDTMKTNNPGYFTYDKTTRTLTMTAENTTSNSVGLHCLLSDFVENGKTYTFSLDVRGTSGKRIRAGWDDGNYAYITLTEEYTRVNFTTTASEANSSKRIIIYTVASGGLGVGEWFQFDNVQIEEVKEGATATATAYTPYIEDFSTVTLKVLGKNLLPFPYYDDSKTIAGVDITVNDDRSVTLKGTATGNVYFFLDRGTDFGEIGMNAMDTEFGSNGVYTCSKRLYYNYVNKTVSINIKSGVTVDETLYPQVELSNKKATSYEPYIEPVAYPVGVDGTVEGIKSISPNMTLIADGVHMDVTYRRSFGMQNEYDRFWDAYQENGKRTYYLSAFSGINGGNLWDEKLFRPKYDIKPTRADSMFRFMAIKDLETHLNNCGVALDTSNTTHFNLFFGESKCEIIPTIDITGLADGGTTTSMFSGCYSLHTLRKLIVKETISFNNGFLEKCNKLKNLIIEGTIGKNGFNVQWSTELTHDSLMSIINALKDYSGDTSGTAWTVTIGATNKAKLTEEELTIASNKGWTVN